MRETQKSPSQRGYRVLYVDVDDKTWKKFVKAARKEGVTKVSLASSWVYEFVQGGRR